MWVFLNKKLVVQMVPFDNIIPAFAKIEFHISCCWPLDHSSEHRARDEEYDPACFCEMVN